MEQYSTKELMASLNYPMGSGAWTDEHDNAYLDKQAAIVRKHFPLYKMELLHLGDEVLYAAEIKEHPDWLAWLLSLAPSDWHQPLRDLEMQTEDPHLAELLRAARMYTALMNEVWANA